MTIKNSDWEQWGNNLTMGEEAFNQHLRMRNQLVIAAEIFAREENLSPVLIQTLSKDMDEHLKLAKKVVDVVDRTNRKPCVTLQRYSVEEIEKSYAQVRIFAKKKKDDKFQQFVYVNYKVEEFIYLIDVMKSVHDNIIAKKPICNFVFKVLAVLYSLSIFFLFESG